MNGRERLLEAALELFVAHGFDAVGVQEIVEKANVTKPSLYHHFGSKRGLLSAIAAIVDDRLFTVLGDATVYKHDLPRDLERLISALLRFAAECPRHARLLLAAQNGPLGSETRDALGEAWLRLSTDVERFFRDASEDHGNMRGRSREYTVSLLGIVCAYAVLLLDGELDSDPERAHAIARQFSYGIYS
ncbi:MAG: TetR/AcrR family transcriptional regulator [Spirochaetota bacterium]